MRHARADALDTLEPVLVQLRTLPALKEKSRGTFYRGSRAFLHFHEDPAGLFADVKTGEKFVRVRVSTASERKALMTLVRSVLGAP